MKLQIMPLKCGCLCVGPTAKRGAFTPKVIDEIQGTSKANRSILKVYTILYLNDNPT